MFAVGKLTVKDIFAPSFTAFSKLLGHLLETTTCKFFFRLKIDKGMYHSLGYERVDSRNSYSIKFGELSDSGRVLRKFGFIKENYNIFTMLRVGRILGVTTNALVPF